MSKLNQEFYAPLNYKPDIKRAFHNLSKKVSLTPHTGLNTIVYNRRLYPGDDFKISTGTLLQTINPLVRPLLDCFELRLEYYFEPLSNLYGYMDNNTKESTADIVEKSPKWTAQLFGNDYSIPDDEQSLYRIGILGRGMLLYEDGDISYTPPSDDFPSSQGIVGQGSLLEAIGVPAGFQGVGGSDVYSYTVNELGNSINIEPLLVYLDIMRTYHLNTQTENVYVCTGLDHHTADLNDINDCFDTTIFGAQRVLDDFFLELRYMSKHRDADLHIQLPISTAGTWGNTFVGRLCRYIQQCSLPYGGWFPCQYKPDLWRNLLSTSVGEVKSYINVVDGQVSIDEIREKNKWQRFVDAVDLSGGRYKNLIRTVLGWDTSRQMDIPQLLAVQRTLIDPSNITATASSGGVDLAQMAAKVDRYNSSKPIRVKADVDGYLMVIANITPIVGYSQGFEPNLLRKSMNDDWNPNFANLGFRSVPEILYTAYPRGGTHFDTGSGEGFANYDFSSENVVGKQIAWIEEITDVNRSYGQFNTFNGLYRDMVLTRKYSDMWARRSLDGTVLFSDTRTLISPYVNPLEHIQIFQTDGNFAPPWSLHCGFNIQALRPLGKRYRPNLE